MRHAFITFIIVFVTIPTIQAGDVAMAFGSTNITTINKRATFDLGIHVRVNDNVQILGLGGITPVSKKHTNALNHELHDWGGALSIDCIIRPWDSSLVGLLFGIHSEHVLSRNKTLGESEYQHSIVFGEVGVSLYFAKNWAIAGLYRTGIIFPHVGKIEVFTPNKKLSFRIYCWVI